MVLASERRLKRTREGPPGMYYKVQYEGTNPKTKRPWRAAWVHENDLGTQALNEWLAAQAGPSIRVKKTVVISDDDDNGDGLDA